MLWLKSLHIVAVVSWYAGIFYLPRLFVYHAMTPANDHLGHERFKTMERKLYVGIMHPSAIVTVITGLWLWFGYGFDGRWLDWKVALVIVLVLLHIYFGKLIRDFRDDRNAHGHDYYRWLNEIPALPILIAVVILVVVKPF